ncbi:hypothetical protein [Sphingomonas aurantiaca]|uniref:hypothetical protein n=1 Tax=Sphingomonas aurantiaca TaxID=185949 RepID=UPI001FC9CC98|nr:hypothetical protein [Sphingomonas aurantiaca]
MPHEAGARTGEAFRRIADDRRRPPIPFLQEMVGKVFKPRLHAPVLFAGHEDEDEGIGRPDLFGGCLQSQRRLAARMVLIDAVDHGKVDRLGVDELGRCTPLGEGADEPLAEANALPIGTIEALEDQNPLVHRGNFL